MAEVVAKGLHDPKTAPLIIRTARAIVSDAPERDDQAELEAIFEAVRFGTDKVPGLKRGLRYVSDPRVFDYFSSAGATLKACEGGSCGGDCDDHAILVASLCLSLGFKAGLRAWGPGNRGVYEHVYCVVAVPKHGPWPRNYSGTGMDTTAPSGHVGWEPPKGSVKTYWIEEG